MTKLRTHYDNLKVARDAPPEVIRAAYKSLAQKYHPDRNPGDARAADVMSLLNQAYAVLSDRDQRREHDDWIASQERRRDAESSSERAKPGPPPQAKSPSEPSRRRYSQSQPQATGPGHSGLLAALGSVAMLAIRLWPLTLIAGVLLINALSSIRQPPSGPAPYTAQAPLSSGADSSTGDIAGADAPAEYVPTAAAATTESPPYARPAVTPSGEAWPTLASYLLGEPRLNTDGLSQVTVDNQQNDADVLVKLVEITPGNAHPVRTLFIPARREFTVENVNSGKYDIRYRDLSSGHLARSEPFDLEENPTADGTQYSTVTITLYKVANGNMQTYDLAESEF